MCKMRAATQDFGAKNLRRKLKGSTLGERNAATQENSAKNLRREREGGTLCEMGQYGLGNVRGVKNILLFLQGRLERCGYERFCKPHQPITNQQFTLNGLEVMRISEIEAYIYNEIVPRYSAFDNAHKEDHALTVIRQSEALLEGRAAWLAEQAEADKAKASIPPTKPAFI